MAMAVAMSGDPLPPAVNGSIDTSLEGAPAAVASDRPSDQDWPYAIGFRAENEQREPVELKIEGTIPAYAAGTIYRLAPSVFKVKTDRGKDFNVDHWFDGLTTAHRFKLEATNSESVPLKVWYNSRRTVDELVEKIRKTGRLDDFTFGNKRDPCESIFRKAMTTFKAPLYNPKGKSTVNVGVTLTANMPGIPKQPGTSSHSTKINTLISKTDSSIYQRLDPDTLEPLGVCNQLGLHPDLKGPVSAAHAKTDPITGDVFNFNLDFGPNCVYRVFQASAETGKVEILAKFSAPPAYLHSLFLTPSTVVLCVWNSRFPKHGIPILFNRNVLDSIVMERSQPAEWIVIDRTSARRGVIATYTTDPLFCFHTINAYEEPSEEDPNQVDIIADMAAYEDTSILHGLYYSALVPELPPSECYKAKYPTSNPSFARYRLPSVPIVSKETGSAPSKPRPASRIIKAPSDISPELPSINPNKNTLKHRYVYGVRNGMQSSFLDGLLKYDTETGTALVWSEHAQTPGEMIYVPDPDAQAEDDGVLLSVVLNGLKERSYLLCLDARNMKEIGRAEVPIVIGHGFHGLRVPAVNPKVYNGGD